MSYGPHRIALCTLDLFMKRYYPCASEGLQLEGASRVQGDTLHFTFDASSVGAAFSHAQYIQFYCLHKRQ